MPCWPFTVFRRRKKIIISPRWSDILAGFENDNKKWRAGKSFKEALGDFVFHHQKELGIDVQMAFGDKPIRPLGVSYVTITEDQYDILTRTARWSQK